MALSKIILKGYIVVSDEELPKIKNELLNHIELTRQEEGCLVFEVSQAKEDENVFNVYEEFTDRESFDAHQSRVKTSRWGQVAKRVERHYQIIEEK